MPRKTSQTAKKDVGSNNEEITPRRSGRSVTKQESSFVGKNASRSRRSTTAAQTVASEADSKPARSRNSIGTRRESISSSDSHTRGGKDKLESPATRVKSTRRSSGRINYKESDGEEEAKNPKRDENFDSEEEFEESDSDEKLKPTGKSKPVRISAKSHKTKEVTQVSRQSRRGRPNKKQDETLDVSDDSMEPEVVDFKPATSNVKEKSFTKPARGRQVRTEIVDVESESNLKPSRRSVRSASNKNESPQKRPSRSVQAKRYTEDDEDDIEEINVSKSESTENNTKEAKNVHKRKRSLSLDDSNKRAKNVECEEVEEIEKKETKNIEIEESLTETKSKTETIEIEKSLIETKNKNETIEIKESLPESEKPEQGNSFEEPMEIEEDSTESLSKPDIKIQEKEQSINIIEEKKESMTNSEQSSENDQESDKKSNVSLEENISATSKNLNNDICDSISDPNFQNKPIVSNLKETFIKKDSSADQKYHLETSPLVKPSVEKSVEESSSMEKSTSEKQLAEKLSIEHTSIKETASENISNISPEPSDHNQPLGNTSNEATQLKSIANLETISELQPVITYPKSSEECKIPDAHLSNISFKNNKQMSESSVISTVTENSSTITKNTHSADKRSDLSLNGAENCSNSIPVPQTSSIIVKNHDISVSNANDSSGDKLPNSTSSLKNQYTLLPGCKYVINSKLKENVLQSLKNQTFGFLSYNLGSDLCMQKEKLLNELHELNSHIVCFQQVSKPFFLSVLEPSLDAFGYKGVFSQPEDSVKGMATMFKTSQFKLINHMDISLRQLVEKELEMSPLEPTSKAAVKSYVKRCGNALLTHLSIGTQTIVVVNVQIPASEFSTHALQVSCLAREINKISGGSNKPVLIGGEFNISENDASYQLLRDGYLSNDMIDELQQRREIAVPEKENSSLVDLLWKSFQHPSSNLCSCYTSVLDHELFIPELKKTSPDLLWYSSDSLHTVGVVDVTSVKPGDCHYYLKADIGFSV